MPELELKTKCYFMIIDTKDKSIFDQLAITIEKITEQYYYSITCFTLSNGLMTTNTYYSKDGQSAKPHTLCLIDVNNFGPSQMLDALDVYRVQINVDLVPSTDPSEQPQRIQYKDDAQSLAEICLVCIENTLEHFDRTFTPVQPDQTPESGDQA